MLAHFFLAFFDNTTQSITSNPASFVVELSAAVYDKSCYASRNLFRHTASLIMSVLTHFNSGQIATVVQAADLAEELVNDFFKTSESQWLHQRYDIKTLCDLQPEEIVYGPFAQVVRYQAQKKDSALGSAFYDFYKICLQDHTICPVLHPPFNVPLFPLMLYVTVHELVHIVRFSKFLQYFDATPEETLQEETRVHRITRAILHPLESPGMQSVFDFFSHWQTPLDYHCPPLKNFTQPS